MQTYPIPGFRRYLIAEDGSAVINAATLKPLTIQIGERGEPRVSLTKDDGKFTCVAVSRLLAVARGERLELPENATAIPGYEGYYITPAGEVYSKLGDSLDTVRKLSLRPDDGGYSIVTLSNRKVAKVHALVLLTFVGPKPSPKHEVRHLNGDKTDNRLSNLAWGTKKENMADRERHGTVARGQRNGLAVLDEDKVREIRRLRDVEGLTFIEIGKRFGIHRVTVRHICLRVLWAHVV